MKAAAKFQIKSKLKAADREHYHKLNFNISKYENAFENGRKNYKNLSLAREFVSQIKAEAVDKLPELLTSFENNIVSRGTQVIWAFDKNEAHKEIQKIVEKHAIKSVVKSKSMISEELELNEFMERVGVDPIETDLGEFIVQKADEKPYHILTPAMHKSKEDVAALFHKKFKTPSDASPEFLTQYARRYLRDKYKKADAGITGANFLIADIGAVALTENEGNGVMSVGFPDVHIVLAGIERIIPSVKHLGGMWQILAQYGTGQQITVYNSLFLGPKKEGESNGPKYMYVILLDNGRSDLYNTKPQNEALKCIRCGACLNACPIYKSIGGHTFGKPYTGPIGSVITPIYEGKEYDHFSSACSLCGKCAEVCPAKIDLPKLILHNRNLAHRRSAYNPLKTGLKLFQRINSNAKNIEIFNSHTKNIIFRFGKKHWGMSRSIPKFSEKSFRQLWNEEL